MVKKGGGRGSGRGKGAGGQGKQAPRRAQTRTQTIKELSMARGASEEYYEKGNRTPQRGGLFASRRIRALHRTLDSTHLKIV